MSDENLDYDVTQEPMFKDMYALWRAERAAQKKFADFDSQTQKAMIEFTQIHFSYGLPLDDEWPDKVGEFSAELAEEFKLDDSKDWYDLADELTMHF